VTVKANRNVGPGRADADNDSRQARAPVGSQAPPSGNAVNRQLNNSRVPSKVPSSGNAVNRRLNNPRVPSSVPSSGGALSNVDLRTNGNVPKRANVHKVLIRLMRRRTHIKPGRLGACPR